MSGRDVSSEGSAVLVLLGQRRKATLLTEMPSFDPPPEERRENDMAKILQIRETQQHHPLVLTPGCKDVEETAAEIVALMQARFYRPSAKEMLEILHCSADQIFAMRN